MGTLRLLIFILLLVPAVAMARPPRGYVEEDCNFDMNRDGERGGALDCDVCNHSVASGLIQHDGENDPDHDNFDEDIYYVDCGSGTNNNECGVPGKVPCATIEHAMNQRADGPNVGQEDIICFTGACSLDGVVPDHGGKIGHYTKAKEGSEEIDFQYPSNPTMLVGWDVDQDGIYPPVDNHLSVLAGSGLARAFDWIKPYTEFAHFSVQNYGIGFSTGGFAKVTEQGRPSGSHIYVHDIAMANILKDSPLVSGAIVFDVFHTGTLSWFSIENIECTECGGFFMRGSGESGAKSWRYKNIDVTFHGCDTPTCTQGLQTAGISGFKVWGEVDGMEILDSWLDGNHSAWTVDNNGNVIGFQPAQCINDVVIRNNRIIDMKIDVQVQSHDGGSGTSCESRWINSVVMENNLSTNDFAWQYGSVPLELVGGNATTDLGSLTVTNNSYEASVTSNTCIYYHGGNSGRPNNGAFVYSRNECDTAVGHNLSAMVKLTDTKTYIANDWTIKDNWFKVSGTNLDVGATVPTSLLSDWNAYTGGNFKYNGSTHADLAAWKLIDPPLQDANSVLPEPTRAVMVMAAVSMLAWLRRRWR